MTADSRIIFTLITLLSSNKKAAMVAVAEEVALSKHQPSVERDGSSEVKFTPLGL